MEVRHEREWQSAHKDEDRKQAYLARHKNNERWEDYKSAGSLSKNLLWSKPSFYALNYKWAH